MSSYLERKKRFLIMGSGGWWCPPNFDPDDCLAAYQFKGAGNEADSLIDLTGHGYTLTKTGDDLLIFNNDTGYTFNGRNRPLRNLHNSSVTGIKSVIVRYSDISGSIGQMAFSVQYHNFSSEGHEGAYHGLIGAYVSDRIFNGNFVTLGVWPENAEVWDRSAIFGHNIGSGAIPSEYFLNKEKKTPLYSGGFSGYSTGREPLFGNNNTSWGNLGSFRIQAGAFYKRWLTAEEMSHIHDQVAAL